MSGNQGDLSECLRCARHFPLWIASPHGCVYLRLAPNHCSNRALGQRLKLAVFGRLRQLRLLLMAAARDIRLKPKVCSPH
jgi:hypothetical protein